MAGVQATSETALLFDCHFWGAMVVVIFTAEGLVDIEVEVGLARWAGLKRR